MKKHYGFEMSGTGGNGQSWKTKGSIECEWNDLWQEMNLSTFAQLTEGRAIYGQPGVACKGPYDIDRIVIEKVKQ
jgi:hypothetical protein